MDLSAKKKWYTDWFNSPYYHLLYTQRSDRAASAFIDKLVQYLHAGPGATMLYTACGKGAYARQLTDKGFEVTGIDLSEESIKAARWLENDRLDFYCHDMRLPFRINYYDFVFSFFTGFGYFDCLRDNGNALRSMTGALKKNGVLVMDYLNSSYEKERLADHELKVIKGVEFDIRRGYEKGYFHKNIHISDVVNMQELCFTERVAAYTLQDLEAMFARQRLEILDLFGDYHFNRYDARFSNRLILVAKKT